MLKALDPSGAGYTSNVINAINFAITNKATFGIDVMNLSLGHPDLRTGRPRSAGRRRRARRHCRHRRCGLCRQLRGDPVTREVGYAGITSPGNAPDAITVGALETFQTVTRRDDRVAWYSSRGPSWYDGYQKPDVVAPGSHLASDVSAGCALIKQYPKGDIATSGTCNLMRLSGTSMSAAGCQRSRGDDARSEPRQAPRRRAHAEHRQGDSSAHGLGRARVRLLDAGSRAR